MIRKKSKFVFKVKGFHARVPLLIMYKKNNYIGRNIFSQFYVFK